MRTVIVQFKVEKNEIYVNATPSLCGDPLLIKHRSGLIKIKAGGTNMNRMKTSRMRYQIQTIVELFFVFVGHLCNFYFEIAFLARPLLVRNDDSWWRNEHIGTT